jgi:hypothetical protein
LAAGTAAFALLDTTGRPIAWLAATTALAALESRVSASAGIARMLP